MATFHALPRVDTKPRSAQKPESSLSRCLERKIGVLVTKILDARAVASPRLLTEVDGRRPLSGARKWRDAVAGEMIADLVV